MRTLSTSAGHPVHALWLGARGQEAHVPIGAEDAALVGVEDAGRAMGVERLAHAPHDLARAHRVREPQADYIAAEPSR